MSLSFFKKDIENIMRNDKGLSGTAQRLEQLAWMLFLKIIDDKDIERESFDSSYKSSIPKEFQWRNWAGNDEGITGDDLINFIDNPLDGLFISLANLDLNSDKNKKILIKQIFSSTNNFMKSGFILRQVINRINRINFNNHNDKHVFGDIYEDLLLDLREAGGKGEHYTPRPITKLMVEMIKPKVGDNIIDPSAGTGGFLVSSLDFLRKKEIKTSHQELNLANNIIGWELKPISYVMGVTNLILHDIDVPNYTYHDSLMVEYRSLSEYEVDIVVANPPFGASVDDQAITNFPKKFQTKESALLFVVQIIELLKEGGKAAIVLSDGCITGSGVYSRIREKLLKECNLHTIIKLPQSTFHPATVPTNLLFFDKGEPTNDIWYYEHNLPKNQKSYSKTKPIRYEEFNQLKDWWNQRKEGTNSWCVNINDLDDFDLDIKNPATKIETETRTPEEIMESIKSDMSSIQKEIQELLDGISRNA